MEWLKKFRVYFKEAKEEIANQNINVIFYVSITGLILTAFFVYLTPFLFPAWKITWEYGLLIAVAIAFLIFSAFYRKKKEKSYLVAQTVTLLFCLLVLFCLVLISVFPYPDGNQVYISMYFMLLPILLIIRPYQIVSIMIGGEIAFVLLTSAYKLPEIKAYDIFSTFAAALFAVVAMLVILTLRVKDYESRMKYYHDSRVDLLTGTFNKSTFRDESQLRMQRITQTKAWALFVMDLDEFKEVNDTFGHQQGDRLIHEVGEMLTRRFEKESLVGRFGGDEFCLLFALDETNQEEFITQKVDVIQKEVSRIAKECFKIDMSVSIGVAVKHGEQIGYEQLFVAADTALYEAKDKGRNRVEIVHIK